MNMRRARQLQGKLGSLNEILSEVRRTVNTVESAQHSIESASASASIMTTVHDLKVRVQHLEDLAKSLRDDYEMMTAEVELQREVALRLCAATREGTPLSTLRRLEGEIRLQITSERATPEREDRRAGDVELITDATENRPA